MKTKKVSPKSVILNVLGGAGYLAWVMQLLLLVTLYFQSFQQSSVGQFVLPTPTNDVVAPPRPDIIPIVTLPPSGLFLIVSAALGLVFVAFAVYLVFMQYIPVVNKTAKTVVHQVAEQVVAQTEHRTKKRLPVRKRRVLTARIVLWLKVIFSLSPLPIVLIFGGSEYVSNQSAVFIMTSLSLWAVTCFAVQAVLAHVWPKTAPLE